MNLVLFAFLILGGLGLVFGGVLAFASRVCAVEVDPREEAIAGCLPGANCGGCGYPGCGGYAAAVVKGEAPVNKCAAGGAAVEDVALFREHISPDVRIKAAGGIRTFEQAQAMLEAGADRIGASALVALYRQEG